MITAEQIAHFQTFGFLALKQAFSRDEMAEIGRVFDTLLESDRLSQPVLDEKQQSRYHRLQSIYGVAERHPTLTGLVADDRIYETVCHLLGHGCRWLCSEGHRYLGDTKWHPDGGSTQDYPFIKVSLYLEPLTKDTGCLRVIPGSHRSPLHDDLKFWQTARDPQIAQLRGLTSPDPRCRPFRSNQSPETSFS